MTGGVTRSSKLILLSSCRGQAKRVDQRYFSRLRGAAEELGRKEESQFDREHQKTESSSSWKSSWVPDPRTGIYVPKGHEWVINDVPKGAASLDNQTFWLRNVDGVLEKPDPGTAPEHYYHMHI